MSTSYTQPVFTSAALAFCPVASRESGIASGVPPPPNFVPVENWRSAQKLFNQVPIIKKITHFVIHISKLNFALAKFNI